MKVGILTFCILLGGAIFWGVSPLINENSNHHFKSEASTADGKYVKPEITENVLSEAEKAILAEKSIKLDSIFNRIHKRRGFNGNVLIAQKGTVLINKSFGYKKVRGSKEKLETNDIFQLASVSKQFTAVSIMLLKQKGKLGYDDPIHQYLPNFPYSKEITIRHLLTHRSGLPNYIYLADKKKDRKDFMSNQEMMDLFFTEKPQIYGQPNGRFSYNNTNYFLLACIVEKVAEQPFPEFLDKNILQPLDMKDTFAWNSQSISTHSEQMTTGYSSSRRAFNEYFLDGIYGDKSIYSTTEDLYKWSKGISTYKVLNKETLDEAFKDSIAKTKSNKNYGFGYRIFHCTDGTNVIYHGGWWRGYATLFAYYPTTDTTVIMLSNIVNKAYVNINSVLDLLEIPEFKRVG